MQTRIVQINTTCGVGSTGKIAVSISELLTQKGIENEILFSTATNGYNKGIACGNARDIKVQALKSRILGNYGFNSRRETKRIIAELERFSPSAVLLHNIHGHDCNLEMLFSYFKERNIKLFWTFHDCWAFTGYCTHFTYAKCVRWKTGCHHCPQRKQYSWFFDRSESLYRKKKQLFSGLDLTIITPSQWLADLVKESFLSEYPVKVIHNGIDLTVFQPTPGNFREKYNIPAEKYVLLGVAFGWGVRKGLDVFIELSKRLDPPKYQIVLVGTDDAVDRQLPGNVISIHRTQNQQELAGIYAAADLFLNPTREDNYPTVNMEAQACGTPVVTFSTGGSMEMVDARCGFTVQTDDLAALERAIVRGCNEKEKLSSACLKYAESFDKNEKFAELVNLILMECEV